MLFTIILAEKHSFLQAKKTTKNAALAKLTLCSSVVRTVVKAGVHKLKNKTVEAVIDHLTQTVLKANGEFCEPIAQHYLQALISLLEYCPIVERMKTSLWNEVIDFCLKGMWLYVDFEDGSDSIDSLSHPSSNLSDPRRQFGSIRSVSRHNVEDILRSLLCLLSVPHTRMLEKAEDSASALVRFLTVDQSTIGQTHQLALSGLNKLLSFIRMDRTSLTQTTIVKVMESFARLWQCKSLGKNEMLNSLRDEMLIMLFLTHLHLEHAILQENNSGLGSILLDLYDALVKDYARRIDRDQLQIDDLDLADLGGDCHRGAFRLAILFLKPQKLSSERAWAHLQAIAILERLLMLLERKTVANASVAIADGQSTNEPRKRQRVLSRLDHITDALVSQDRNLRLTYLHLLPFLTYFHAIERRDHNHILQYVLDCVSDKNGSMASWALLSLTR